MHVFEKRHTCTDVDVHQSTETTNSQHTQFSQSSDNEDANRKLPAGEAVKGDTL